LADTVLIACALMSIAPALVTFAPSPMKASVVVATLLSIRTPATAASPAASDALDSVEFEVDVA
jgi:hypothetical protein